MWYEQQECGKPGYKRLSESLLPSSEPAETQGRHVLLNKEDLSRAVPTGAEGRVNPVAAQQEQEHFTG